MLRTQNNKLVIVFNLLAILRITFYTGCTEDSRRSNKPYQRRPAAGTFSQDSRVSPLISTIKPMANDPLSTRIKTDLISL